MEGLGRIATLPGDDEALDPDLISHAASVLARSFDEREGGFGSQPKFPNSMSLEVFLRNHARTGQPEDLNRVTKTLEKMARGGIYDQLGGGFHRYSVDHRWLVPHFEKMLYDNALLAKLYIQTYQIAGDPLFLRIGTETLDYVIREMTSESGGFYSTQDADSEGEEGRFFVWTPDEINEVLGEATSATFCAVFDVHDIGNFGGKSILNCPIELHSIADQLGLSLDEVNVAIEEGRRKLLEVRSKRVWPGRDDKIQVSWNGLMISAFAVAYQVTGEGRFIDAGVRAARFILENMVQGDGRLFHSFKDGAARHNAYLDDYAGLMNGLIDLYESTFETSWLLCASELAEMTIAQFWDDEGDAFFYTGIDHETLIVRSKNPYDNATPSGNSLSCLALLRLGRLMRRADYIEKAERVLRRFQPYLKETPNAFAQMICAADYALTGGVEVILVGGKGRESLLETVFRSWVPCRILAAGPDERIPLTNDLPDVGEAAAYVCRNQTCSAPVTDPGDLERLLHGHNNVPQG
jgi:uncharacterized protein YyaL (SSP411 family)